MPWLFVPEHLTPVLTDKLSRLRGADRRPPFDARITPLEDVQPWRYCSWDRSGNPAMESELADSAQP